jgi:hypothetical protein
MDFGCTFNLIKKGFVVLSRRGNFFPGFEEVDSFSVEMKRGL